MSDIEFATELSPEPNLEKTPRGARTAPFPRHQDSLLSDAAPTPEQPTSAVPTILDTGSDSGVQSQQKPDSPAAVATSSKRRAASRSMASAITVPWESAIPGVPSSQIRAELSRREKRVPRLLAERDRLGQQLDAIEEALESIGEAVPQRVTARTTRISRSPRARNSGSLRSAILATVAVGETVTPRDVVEAVQKSDYRSTSAHFGQLVAGTLTRLEEFVRIGRGQYLRKR